MPEQVIPEQVAIEGHGKERANGFDRYVPAAVAALILLFVYTAWVQRFFLDDAFISFRYAANLVQGHGLVWNPGELPVEGYTNLLWVLIMSIPLKLGGDPVLFSTVLGVLLFAIGLVVQYRLATLVTGKPWAGIAAVLALGGFYTFRVFSTGGLETMLQAVLLLSSFYLAAQLSTRRDPADMGLWLLSTIAGVAFLTRMDSAVIATVVLVWVALKIFRAREGKRRWIGLLALATPLLLISTTLFTWRYSYYGSLLPNTYYAKVSSGLNFAAGISYLHGFMSSYLLYPLLLLVLIAVVRKRRSVPPAIIAQLTACVLWMVYIIRVGGDFMEYRFMVPVIPLLMMSLVWATWEVARHRVLKGLVLILVLLGSVHHQATHQATTEDPFPESIEQLHLRLSDDGEAWVSTGKVLGQFMGSTTGESSENPVTIAVSAAGAIPFYSGLRTVDMLGLSDRWIADNGMVAPGNAPGHKRVAPISYLKEQRVNILIGHPSPYDINVSPPQYLKRAITLAAFMEQENIDQLSPVAHMLEIPLSASRKLVAVYLAPHEKIESLIAQGVFRSYTVGINDEVSQ